MYLRGSLINYSIFQ